MINLPSLALKTSHYCLFLLPPSGLPCFSVNPVLNSSSSSPLLPVTPLPAQLSPINRLQSTNDADFSQFRIARYFRADFHPPSFLRSFDRTENEPPFARRTDGRTQRRRASVRNVSVRRGGGGGDAPASSNFSRGASSVNGEGMARVNQCADRKLREAVTFRNW